MAESAYVMAKQLEAGVGRTLSHVDLHEQDAKVRAGIHALKRELTEVRGEVRGYELAETLAEQQKLSAAARQRLLVIEELVLGLSQHNIFGPIEVVETSAHIDLLRQELA